MRKTLIYGLGGVAILALGVLYGLQYAHAPVPGILTFSPYFLTGTSTVSSVPETDSHLLTFMEVVDSCGANFDGNSCLNMRAGPGREYPVLRMLRNGIVFKVASSTVIDGQKWYQVGFSGEIHYPERVKGEWWVAAEYVHTFQDEGLVASNAGLNASSTKRIVIDVSQEKLTAYDGTTVVMQQDISAGLEDTPTPLGTFWVYRKTPDSYMQGPIEGLSDQYYDLPGVPWDLYFTKDGGAIHGAYWHNHFGQEWSHGCVNLPPEAAKELYAWADLGTPVVVKR